MDNASLRGKVRYWGWIWQTCLFSAAGGAYIGAFPSVEAYEVTFHLIIVVSLKVMT